MTVGMEVVRRGGDVEAIDAGEVDPLIVKLTAARASIGTMDFDSLHALRVWAEVLAAQGRARRAASLAAEATETRIRVERELGRHLLRADDDGLDIKPTERSNWPELAKIPNDLFEKIVARLVGRGSACTAKGVINSARRESLRQTEPGIWVSWDGHYFVASPFPNGSPQHAGKLSTARQLLQRRAGLRKSWRESSASVRLDDSHARARRLSLALSLLGESLTGTARDLVGEAEHHQMRVAELLYEAYQRASTEGALAA